MNPQVRHAQRACEAAKARQAVVVWFDEHGQFAVASYGETKAECTAVKPLCNAIHDAIHEGVLPCPGDHLADHYKSKRALEMESLRDERAAWQHRAEAAEKQVKAIAMLVSIFERQRENEPDEGWPEGDLHPRHSITRCRLTRDEVNSR